MKVESQNRFLQIWWADNIDEVELGYSLVNFRFDAPGINWPQNKPYNYIYEYGDYMVDQYGQFVAYRESPKSLFDRFPIDNDEVILTIYLNQSLHNLFPKIPGVIDFSQKDVNDQLKALAKIAYNQVKGVLKKELGSKVRIVHPTPNRDAIHFTYLNWSESNTNDNKISKIFDWNTAVVGIAKTTGQDGKPIFNPARSYKEYQTIMYGMGRRGNRWKGSRIVLAKQQ
jgi:hypothetical protein